MVGEASDGAEARGSRPKEIRPGRGDPRRPDARHRRPGGLCRHQALGPGRQGHHADLQRRGGRPLRGGQERRLRLPAQERNSRTPSRTPCAPCNAASRRSARRWRPSCWTGFVALARGAEAPPVLVPAAAPRLTDREMEVLKLVVDRPQQPRDRQGAVHHREHGEEPRPQHPGEAAAPLPDGGRGLRGAGEAAGDHLSIRCLTSRDGSRVGSMPWTSR